MPVKGFVLGVLLVASLSGCTAKPSIEIFHVHGLHYDAEGDALFVATHHGLAKGERNGKTWSWDYVGAERYDFMGFTADGAKPGVFYSSGHPDNPYEYGGTSLGLRRSTDSGVTWEQRSLKGQADFHALTTVPGVEGAIVGWANGKTMASANGGLNWTEHSTPRPNVYALAATHSTVWAGTDGGLYRSRDGMQTWDQVGGLNGTVASLSISADGQTRMASVFGTRTGVYVASSGGTLWKLVDDSRLRDIGAPVRFALDPGDSKHAFAADAGGLVLETRDGGGSWTKVR